MDKKVLTKLEVETWLNTQVAIRRSELRAKRLSDEICSLCGVKDDSILITGATEICSIMKIDHMKQIWEYGDVTGTELSFFYDGFRFHQLIAREIIYDGE